MTIPVHLKYFNFYRHLPKDQAYFWRVNYIEDEVDFSSEDWVLPAEQLLLEGADKWEDIDWERVRYFMLCSMKTVLKTTAGPIFPILLCMDFKEGHYYTLGTFDEKDCLHQMGLETQGELKPEDRYCIKYYKEAHADYEPTTGEWITHIDSYHVEVGDKIHFCIKD